VSDDHTPAVQVVGVGKRFGDTVAISRADLSVASGEFFSLLGPSGSGKTTLLRIIAGFEQPSEGAVLLNGVDVTNAQPFDRDVHTVFQDYALFPHLTVGQNVEYPLRIRRVGRTERRHRAAEALAMVRLEGFVDRKPGELSGGQRQRVALARALINRPSVLLLDEPLGALDLKLREEMQVELKSLQREVGITFIFVTHDQQEALTMSDRIAVFERGRIAQVGAPRDIYERPATAFVAGFVGTSNLIDGSAARALVGRAGAFLIRPEKLRIAGADVAVGSGRAAGVITEVQYLGWETRTHVHLDAGVDVITSAPNNESVDAPLGERGDRVVVAWDPDHLVPVAPDDAVVVAPDGSEIEQADRSLGGTP